MISLIDPNTKNIIDLQKGRLLMIQGGSWDDYWAISSEDTKVEYIGEVLYIHSPANLDHELIFGELLHIFKKYLEENNVGSILGSCFPIKVADGKRVEPDLIFLSNEDMKSGDLTKTVFEGSPSLIIEIISPNYRDHDTKTKFDAYQKINVGEYIIIDPERREIRQIKFKDQQISYEKLITEGTFNPLTKEVNEISIDIDKLWEMTLS